MPSSFGAVIPEPGQSALSLAWLDSSGAIISVRFDAVTSETHEALMTITDHPVEVGANVVDNAREMPQTIAIEGYVSNKPLASNPGVGALLKVQPLDLTVELPNQPEYQNLPLNLPKKDLQPSLTVITGAIKDLLHPPPSSATVRRPALFTKYGISVATQSPSGDFPDRVRDMYEALTKARVDRSLIRVVSAIEDIDAMMISQISVPRTIEDGNGATFHVELRKIRLVSSESVNAPAAAEDRGKVAVSKGSKGNEKAAPQLKSLLAGSAGDNGYARLIPGAAFVK